MFKYVTLCSFVILCVPCKCDYDLKEGAECTGLDGVLGICVNEKRCFSALDNQSERLPRCLDVEEGKPVVCCSDCQLVDDTSNAVISPTGGVYWKIGNKATDNCLQYLKELPYKCRETNAGGVTRELDQESECHYYNNWTENETIDFEDNKTNNRTEYPHQALLGYGDTPESADWLAGGSIISDRFILTAAHVRGRHGKGELTFVALGVLSVSNPSGWQVHKVKRFITHPSYYSNTYHDIALIETETKIKFVENVLPACLAVESIDIQTTEAVATTWWDLKEEGKVFADSIQTIQNIEPFPEEICNSTYYKYAEYRYGGFRSSIQMCFASKKNPSDSCRIQNIEPFPEEICNSTYYKYAEYRYGGFRSSIQMCFASKKNPSDSCRGLSGEPLLINNQISSCLYTVIGVTSLGAVACGPTAEDLSPEVYTRVSSHVPWIESVVWP